MNSGDSKHEVFVGNAAKAGIFNHIFEVFLKNINKNTTSILYKTTTNGNVHFYLTNVLLQ
jgi:hypothetical protein